MTNEHMQLLETPRLRIRSALKMDAPLIRALWSDPRVTVCVGFPNGIPTSVEEIEAQIERDWERPLKQLLIVERQSDGEPVGEVKLGEPGTDGICEPDIKLFPDHWAQGYGVELWSTMIAHLFAQDGSEIVQGTPNIANTASVRMMERCGMTRMGEGRFVPGGPLRDSMTDVPHYIYQIRREDWLAGRSS